MEVLIAIEPIKLTLAGTDRVIAHACGKCHSVARDEDSARYCCMPRPCECGMPSKSGRDLCAECQQAKDDKAQAIRDAMLAAKFDKAKKITPAEWDGMVTCNGEWFDCLDYMRDHVIGCDEDRPAWIFASHRMEFFIDADAVIENALDDHHEDAGDKIGTAKRAELQTFLGAWIESTGVFSWSEDESTVILLGPDFWADSQTPAELHASWRAGAPG